MARPNKYSQEIADKICERIATTSLGLRAICKEVDITTFTVLKWLSDKDKPEFSIQYARAKEQQADFLADEIIEIADKELETTERTECMNADGSYTSATTKDNHNRTRLMIDARKWKASKLAPKKYGDKMDLTTGGDKITSYSVGFKKPEAEN